MVGQTGVYFDSGGHRLLGTLFLTNGRRPAPTAVLLHGLPGIEKNYDIAHALREAGWNSLIFHYRGSWGSAGDYTLATIPDDVRAPLDFLDGHEDVAPDRLVLVGHSLGGWAAVLSGASDERVRGVAVVGPVADPPRLPFADEEAAQSFVPWLHGISTGGGFIAQWNELGDDLNPTLHAARLAPRPLLIVHGEKDDVIPVEQARALYEGRPLTQSRSRDS